ncbi:glycosyltransferase family 2 protein [Nitrospira sp. Kam-Ns4a]
MPKSDRPVVSAIITTFNRKRFLGPAISSVLAQTFRDFELLILDNSSTDGTEELVSSFADSRIRYIRHPPLTIGQQRNLGVREARGEYIGFLDDDDEWLPAKLERQLEVFRTGPSDLALVYGGFVRIDSEGREFAVHRPVLRGRILLDLLRQRDAFTGSASNPLMRVSALRALGGYNDELCTSEDWELYLRLAERHSMDFTEENVVRIRSHRGPRLGDRVGEALKAEAIVFNRYQSTMDARLRSFYLQKMGGKQCRLGFLQEGRRAIIQAIRENPVNVVAYAQYAMSWLGPNIYQAMHRAYKRFF